MKRRTLIFSLLIVATLVLALTSCAGEGQNLDGKNIVTFELSGGTLELKTSSVSTKINFAYVPDTYILDPTEIPGYRIYRQGYNFTGWYKTAECNPQDLWDFNTPFSTETLTLYAGWQKAINYTYSVYYTEGDEAVKLGTYNVSAGDKFEDWRKFAETRADHTAVGYYSDKDLTTAWDNAFAHPGGEVDTDIAVYVDYIDGKWKLVDTFSKLVNALSSGENAYLTKDIDCNGAAFNIKSSYGGIFEGNGYKVTNFVVEKSGSLRPSCSIFSELSAGAEIRNVSFENVTYTVTSISANVSAVKMAALAVLANNVKITNVSISGTLVTDYTGELPKFNSAVYEYGNESEDNTEIVDFTANITVEQK